MKYYVREKLQKWISDFQPNVMPKIIAFNFRVSSIGYLEVFDSMEAFDKAYPLEKPLIFESVEDIVS